jgi:hypothetical protein
MRQHALTMHELTWRQHGRYRKGRRQLRRCRDIGEAICGPRVPFGTEAFETDGI